MGFYVRRGLNFGPLRLNLSRSGLGASFGVKGARIGIGPRGSYVHMGRGGLYYRQTLSSAKHVTRNDSPTPPENPSGHNPQQEIASATAVTMADSSATTLLSELNRVKKRRDRFPIIAVIGATVLYGMWAAGTAWWLVALVFAATFILSIYARHSDVLKGTAILNYSLESEAAQNFSRSSAAAAR